MMLFRRYTRPVGALVLFLAMTQPAIGAANGGSDGDSRAINAGRPLIGQPGPSGVLTTIDGQRIDLATLYGKKPVYLKFWATWCGPCLQQMPGFERMYEKYAGRIAVVAVNTGFSETEANVRDYRARHALRMPVVIDDGRLARALNLRVTPQHVLIGRDGRIAYVGHLADQRLDAALERVVGEKPAAPVAPATVAAPASKALAAGDAAGVVSMRTIEGKPVAFASGRPQALLFFSPWCETYLRDTRPATARACRKMRVQAERLARESGVQWLGISSPVWATDAELSAYAKARRTKIPLALDRTGEVFGRFGIRQIPSVVLLDAGGRVARVLGPDDGDVTQAVHTLTAGEPK